MFITAGDICSIAGWGKSNHKDDFISDWLTEVDVPIADYDRGAFIYSISKFCFILRCNFYVLIFFSVYFRHCEKSLGHKTLRKKFWVFPPSNITLQVIK